MTTDNPLYSELVKRPWLCGVTGNPVGTDTRMIGEPPCDCQGCRAARAIEALVAEVEKWKRLAKTGGAKCTPEHTWAEWLQKVKAEADRRVEEERERILDVAARVLGARAAIQLQLETAEGAIRSRSKEVASCGCAFCDLDIGPSVGTDETGGSFYYHETKHGIIECTRRQSDEIKGVAPNLQTLQVAPSPVGFSDEEVADVIKRALLRAWAEDIEDDEEATAALVTRAVLTHIRQGNEDGLTAQRTAPSPISQEGSIAAMRLSDLREADAHTIQVYRDDDGSLGLTQANGTTRPDYIALGFQQEAQLLRLIKERAEGSVNQTLSQEGSIAPEALSEEVEDVARRLCEQSGWQWTHLSEHDEDIHFAMESSRDFWRAAARAHLTAKRKESDTYSDGTPVIARDREGDESPCDLTYVAPVQTGAVGSVPGWKLVPVEPTDEMLHAAQERLCEIKNVTSFDDHEQAEMFKAMLGAAPMTIGVE